MRLLFIRWHPNPRIGGLAVNTECLTLELSRRGHEVAELTAEFPALTRPAIERTVRVLASRLPSRRVRRGIVQHRAVVPEAALAAVASSVRPDAVVVSSGGAWRRDWAWAMVRAAHSYPVVLYIYDVASVELAWSATPRPVLAAISDFVAAPMRTQEIAVSVIPPVIDRATYQVHSTRRTVLFVNPTAAKGLDIALQLAAARPDVPFEFVGGDPKALRRLPTLPNLMLRGWTSDPTELFGSARVLLAPSRYPEAWPRVVGEAQASGIPTLGADLGGMREAVRDGGLLISPDCDRAAWVTALGSLWDDRARYESLAAAASRAGERPELRAGVAAARLEELVERARGSFSA